MRNTENHAVLLVNIYSFIAIPFDIVILKGLNWNFIYVHNKHFSKYLPTTPFSTSSMKWLNPFMTQTYIYKYFSNQGNSSKTYEIKGSLTTNLWNVMFPSQAPFLIPLSSVVCIPLLVVQYVPHGGSCLPLSQFIFGKVICYDHKAINI